MLSKLLAVVCFAGGLSVCRGQDTDSAKRVYDAAQDSVFLVYLNDSSGQPEALGSAFLVAPKTLITNAHVVKDGSPVLAVGPVRIPVTVVSRDIENDLAVLHVDVDLTSRPLPLSMDTASPGQRIFAIGNPEGLEKTISEGLVSGVRHLDNRTLLQITSPISHGSSGGPILSGEGKVVGVAVGMLTDGQNLNFAVPVSYVRDLLARKSQPDVGPITGISELSDMVQAVSNETYSAEDESPYQRGLQKLKDSANAFLIRPQSAENLQALACLGDSAWTVLDQAIEAARKLILAKHTPENGALLAYLLLQKADLDSVNAAFSKDGSSEKAAALTAMNSVLDEVTKLASPALTDGRSRSVPLYTFVLAAAKKMTDDYVSSMRLNEEVLPRVTSVCGKDLKPEVYQDLIMESDKLGKVSDAEQWFRRYSAEYTPSAGEWDSEGDRRGAATDYAAAAVAYEKAARGASYLAIDYCWASQDSFLSTPTREDDVLANGRSCVDASVKATSDTQTQQFNARLPIVYRFMATVLEDRGVHQTALGYVKSALAIKPDDPHALYEEALIFEGMEHYSECVSAAQAAIASSDGKFKWMQFGLGGCYFDLENWSQAAASYRIAAEEEKSDPAPAFNLALCYERQGFTSDAKVWFAEALRRNPGPELREKILNAMK
jgi:tetratricopeptide (TPR) repeat protein